MRRISAIVMAKSKAPDPVPSKCFRKWCMHLKGYPHMGGGGDDSRNASCRRKQRATAVAMVAPTLWWLPAPSTGDPLAHVSRM